MMKARKIIFNDEAQKKLVSGVNQLADAVVATLGPRANNVAVDKRWGAPAVLHDGVSVAREIALEDPFENMGAQLVRDASVKTNEAAGDGTTTATLLAQQLVNRGMKMISSGANAMMLRKGMNEAVQAVLHEIKKLSVPVTKEDWEKVATISAQDETIGRKIAQALELVGANGVVEVQEGNTMEIEIDHKEGLEFERGYFSPYFATDDATMEAEVQNPIILITDYHITNVQELIPFMENVQEVGHKNIVIVAESV